MSTRFKVRKNVAIVSRWALIVALFAVMFFPVYTLFRASISRRAELYVRPFRWFPEEPTFDHFLEVLSPGHFVPILPSILNSTIISLGTALLSLILGGLASYAFARLAFRGRGAVFGAVIAVYLLPSVLFLIPLFTIFRDMRLLSSHLGLIIAYTAFIMPFIVIILHSYFAALPASLEEAAKLDGCSHFQVFWLIVRPIAGPAFIAAFVSAFILAWNEFLAPLILAPRLTVVTTALGRYSTTQDIEIGQMAAAGIVTLLPVVVIALATNRYIKRGLVEGALRG